MSAAATAEPLTGLPAAASGAGVAGSHRPERRRRSAGPAWLPLAAVLVVQALLSIRLVWSSTAFQDEALYLWAGHLEWAHVLHGAPLPPLAAYFSGAPVIYSPLGALADNLGGLAGARILSLAFMLGATALLWSVAARLFGGRAAFFAAALFAMLGPTLHLGAFATYDAMSMFLIALAAWCVAGARGHADATSRMIAAGAALALANAAAYSSVLFDPVVLALALLTALPSGRLAARRCATLFTATAGLLAAGLLIGGHQYLTGIGRTTLARVPGTDSALTVLADAWTWTGVIVALAICGVIISWAGRQGGRPTWLLAVLAAAALLGPLEQLSLHTTASLNKHVDLGAWFAAIAAGYAADRLVAAAPAAHRRAVTCACVIALAFPASLGVSQSRAFSASWPNATSFIAIMRPLADHGGGRLLVEDPSIAKYYLPAGSQWQRWSSTRNIVLPSGASTGGPAEAAGIVGPGNPAAFARFISQGYFSLVALNFADTTALDHRIAGDLRRTRHYRIIQVVPYGPGTYVIWRYESRAGHQPGYEPDLRAKPGQKNQRNRR